MVRRLLWKTAASFLTGTSRALEELHSAEELAVASSQARARASLERLLVHAAGAVPFYRERLRAAHVVDERGRVDLDGFEAIPPLTKADIREAGPALLSNAASRRSWRENSSGGSTGEPVRFVQDAAYRDWNRAVKVLFDEWTGYLPGQRKILLWGSERDLFVGKEKPSTNVVRRIKNERWLNAFRMSPADLDRFIREINQFRPRQITGYADSIRELVRHARQHGQRLHRPAAVLCTAARLHDRARVEIQESFGAPVFNRYGSREVGDVACDCTAKRGLHVCVPSHHVELLDASDRPVPPGELGEVVVTLLTNHAMPLIRYRIGDIARWSPTGCECGRPWPLLGDLSGRVTDQFVTSEGALVDGGVFDGLFYFKDWIRRYQVVQNEVDDIAVYFQPTAGVRRSDRDVVDALTDLDSRMKWVMGPRCRIRFEFVETIPPSPSGKHLYFYSHVYRRQRGETRSPTG